MKAEINEDGQLIITAQNGAESYAMDYWAEQNTDPCTGKFICDKPYSVFLLYPYQKKKITLFHRIKLKIQLFLYR